MTSLRGRVAGLFVGAEGEDEGVVVGFEVVVGGLEVPEGDFGVVEATGLGVVGTSEVVGALTG